MQIVQAQSQAQCHSKSWLMIKLYKIVDLHRLPSYIFPELKLFWHNRETFLCPENLLDHPSMWVDTYEYDHEIHKDSGENEAKKLSRSPASSSSVRFCLFSCRFFPREKSFPGQWNSMILTLMRVLFAIFASSHACGFFSHNAFWLYLIISEGK